MKSALVTNEVCLCVAFNIRDAPEFIKLETFNLKITVIRKSQRQSRCGCRFVCFTSSLRSKCYRSLSDEADASHRSPRFSLKGDAAVTGCFVLVLTLGTESKPVPDALRGLDESERRSISEVYFGPEPFMALPTKSRFQSQFSDGQRGRVRIWKLDTIH
ncbi:uncharacterized protein V6R79_014935 [Siganus canaliculatus]